MANPIFPGQGKRAFYLFLSSVLGSIIFLTIYQSLWILYTDFVTLGYVPSIPMTSFSRLFSFIAALLLGMWYGTWLGLHWYELVYIQGDARLFYVFRGGRSQSRQTAPEREFPVKAKQPFADRANSKRWNLEDLFDDKTSPELLRSIESEDSESAVVVRSVEVTSDDAGEDEVESDQPPTMPKKPVRKSSGTKSVRSKKF